MRLLATFYLYKSTLSHYGPHKLSGVTYHVRRVRCKHNPDHLYWQLRYILLQKWAACKHTITLVWPGQITTQKSVQLWTDGVSRKKETVCVWYSPPQHGSWDSPPWAHGRSEVWTGAESCQSHWRWHWLWLSCGGTGLACGCRGQDACVPHRGGCGGTRGTACKHTNRRVQ